MRLKQNLVCLCALLLICASGFAQEVTGSISGTVKDPQGAVVPNATVTLTDTDKKIVARTMKTNGDGEFSAPLVPIGHYSLSVSAPGFKKFEQTGIELNVNNHLTFSPVLSVGAAGDTITVESTANQVELQSSQAAGVINGTQVRELPLNGRNWEQLVTLVPGVSDAGNSDQIYVGAFAPQGTNLVTFSMNGGRREANNFMIDGADNIDRGSNLTLLSFPSVDSIAEFKVIRGQYDPEYGRAGSGQVNVVTRSGTSSLHGNVYEFFRNDVLNATPYFNKHTATPIRKPYLRYNDFGGTIGGPVYIPGIYKHKDKTFFFFSEEARRNLTYSNPHAAVVTSSLLAGNFAHTVCVAFNPDNTCRTTGNSIPAASVDPIAKAYITDIFSKYPAPNAATTADPLGFNSTLRGIFNFREEIYKVDHIFGPKLSVNGKILRDNIPTREPGGLFTNLALDNIGSTETNSPGYSYTFRATITASPTFLIEPGYAFSYGAILSTPVGLLTPQVSPNVATAISGKLPFSTTLGRIPSVSLTGITSPLTFGPYLDYNRNHTGFTNVTKIIGNHSIKAGFSYYHYQKTENAGNGNQGQYTFGTNGIPTAAAGQCVGTPAAGGTCPFTFEQSWANFLLGRIGTFTQSSIDVFPDINANQFEYYAQDAWRIRPNLTFTYGVRHSFFRQPTDARGQLSNFNPKFYDPAKAPCVLANGNLDLSLNAAGNIVSACNPNYNRLNGIIFAHPPSNFFGSAGTQSPYGDKVTNEFNLAIAPRIGLAWDPWGNGKTSIRTGYGMFFDSGQIFGSAEINIFNNPGYLTSLSVTNSTLQSPTGGALGFSAAALRLQSRIATDYKSPYTQQWSLDVQRELFRGWLIDVGYYGNNSIHLSGFYDINQPAEGAYLKCNAVTPCKSGTNNISFTSATTGITSVTSANTTLLNAIRPFIGWNGADAVRNIYTANYNALQSQLQKRFSGATLVNISYTWGHSLTTYVADRSTGNIMPLQGHIRDNNYGPGIGDRRQVLTANFVWDIPYKRNQQGFVGHVFGGWEVSGIQTFQTGLPTTVSSPQSVDPTGAGCLGPSPCVFRTYQVGDPNSGGLHDFDNGWFNPAAFVAPVNGNTAFQTERPGAVRLPGFWRTDLSLFKNIKFTERFGGQFRFETFNTFNHTNPICCSSLTQGNAAFNLVRSTRDPRIAQVALKLSF